MKNFFSLFVLFYLSQNINSQTIKDVVGAYHLRGGSHFMKDDQTFVIIGYATLITGKWEIKEKGLVLFTPDYPKERFSLYGRHSKTIGDSIKIMLSNGFYDDETVLHFGTLKQPIPEMKRIFKPGHHHISFPYVYTTEADAQSVSFSSFPYGYWEDEKKATPEIYTFENKEKYNDFIGYYWQEKHNYKPFYYVFKNGKLYYSDDSFGEKKDLNEALEERELRNMVMNLTSTDFIPEKLFITPLYNEFKGDEEEFRLNFKFNEAKNVWINTLNYIEGEENTEDYDYNIINILNEYRILPNFKKTKSNIKIDQTPIFVSEQDEE